MRRESGLGTVAEVLPAPHIYGVSIEKVSESAVPSKLVSRGGISVLTDSTESVLVVINYTVRDLDPIFSQCIIFLCTSLPEVDVYFSLRNARTDTWSRP